MRTSISPSLRNKFKKLLGMHKKDVNRLSKIWDKKTLQDEINKMAKDKFPSEADAESRMAFSESLYEEVKLKKFKNENMDVLRDLYKAICQYKVKKLDADSLTQNVRKFYKVVSDVKHYSDFESIVYEKYRHDIGSLSKYSYEIKRAVSLGKFITLKLSDAANDPDADGPVVSVTVPTDFRTLKSDMKVKMAFEHNNALKVYDRFVRKYGLGGDVTKELANAIQFTLFERIIIPNFNKIFKMEAKTYKEKWGAIDTSKTHDRYEDDLITVIYFLYAYFVPERCERRAQAFMDKQLRKKKVGRDTDVIPSGTVRGMAGKFEKRRKKVSVGSENGSANKLTKVTRGGGSRVSELKKKFESQ